MNNRNRILKLTDERPYFKPFSYPWAYEAFKQSEQMHWLWSEIPMVDDVKDWKTKLNEDEKTFLTHLYRFFTQGDCYHKDTEVLTDKGYTPFPLLTSNHKVAQVEYNEELSSFTTEFVKPTRIINRYHEGNLKIFKDSRCRTHQSVTPNHNIVYTYKGKLVKQEAATAKIFQNKKFWNTAIKTSGNTTLSPMDRLKIAFQGDGNVKSDVDGSRLGYIPHRFGFKKQRKIDRLHCILNDCNLDYSTTIEDTTNGAYTIFYIKGLKEKLSKTFDWIDLENISSLWAAEFLDELHRWDGTESDDGRLYYYNCNVEAANKAHAVATLAGYNNSFYSKEDNRSEKFNTVYILSWDTKAYNPIDGQSIARNIEEIPYSGQVYCLTVPSGMFITRLYNSVAISGNCDVAGAYVKNYLPVFPQPEVRMMLLSFAAREGIHVAAYSHLIETLGMPDVMYNEFLQYDAMKAKHNFIEEFTKRDSSTIAQQIAVFSAFTEGMQLFSSFAMLMNFSRFGKMKGMGQVIQWSIADETLHCNSMIKLFRQFIKENRDIWTDDLKKEIYDAARTMLQLEHDFIDLAFGISEHEGLTKEDMKLYAMFMADRNLIKLGMKSEFNVRKNPLPWMDSMLGERHTNFFEQKVTDYSKGALSGSWGDIWGGYTTISRETI